MNYDLKDIIIFTSVAKFQSFIKASKSLNISKAVVSGRISALEESLELTLFSRTTREVNLTTSGRAFFDYCSSIIERVDDLEGFLQSQRGVGGALKIVLPPYFGRHHIVPYLDEFLTKYPKLKLEICLTENPVNIISEDYDLQVRIQIPEDENLEVAKLMTNKKVICASPRYIAKFGELETPQDLLKHNCLIFGENIVWQFKHKITREIIKIGDMCGNISCDNGEIIKELVMSGIGITLKSAKDIEKEIGSGEIAILLKEYEVLHKTHFYAVYPSNKYRSPNITAFVEFFREKLYLSDK